MMLSAAKVKRPCPNCRRQLLNLFVGNAITHAPSDAPALARLRAESHPFARSHRVGLRYFSSTRSRFQGSESEPSAEAQPETQPPKADDIETVVRQAKRTFGDTLPKGYLTDEEYKLYYRLYGQPLRETQPADVGMPIRDDGPEYPIEEEEEEYDDSPQEIMMTETNGVYHDVADESALGNQPESTSSSVEDAEEPETGLDLTLPEGTRLEDLPSEAGLTYISAVAKSQREFNALLRLQKDFEAAAMRRAEEEMEGDEFEEVEEEYDDERDEYEEGEAERILGQPIERVHEYTRFGRWTTYPSTLQLPKHNFVTPITQLLERTSLTHVKEAAEAMFGGSGLPFSVATPPTKRNAEQKPVALAAGYHKMSEIDADTFIATMLPGLYASSMGILVEVRKRLGPTWIQKLMFRGDGEGPRVLDVGGAGAGLAAWERVLQAEWDLLRENGAKLGPDPPGRKTAVVGSTHLRQRVSRFLHNTTFLPRLPDYLHSGDHPEKLDGGDTPLPRKQYDIIIASHQVMPLKEGFRRKAYIDNLWEMLSPEGGILIILEKGHPRGFETVADVRARFLDEFIESPNSNPRPESVELDTTREREPGMIIAPCTNHKACPMYLTPGLSHGRKDFCHFSQRFIRPPFLQRILGANHRNHEDIDFSFIAVQRGTLPDVELAARPFSAFDATEAAFKGFEHSPDAPDPLSLPRNILPPIKRHGHVTLDLCTPEGKLERWTVPKSFSRQAYRDARKAKWGDLWAMGAKTRVPRSARLGKGGVVQNDGGVRSQRAAKAGKARRISLDVNSGGIFRASEAGSGSGEPERRNKRGRKSKGANLMGELGLDE